MNNHGLLARLLVAALLGAPAYAYPEQRRVMTIEDLFAAAEAGSVQLRPALSAETEAVCETAVARDRRLPEIDASLSLSFIGDGFTTKRDFSDYQRAPIPHFGNSLTLSVTQPLYAGGAITRGIELAELKSTATRFATELQRDNIRFRLAGFYLDIYKYANLRSVVESNIASARKVLAEMQSRYEQGTSLRNDITRYELLLSSLEVRMIKIDNTLDILNRNLTEIAGLPSDLTVVPDSAVLASALLTGDEEWWQSEAAACSPALLLARQEVEVGRKAEDLIKSGRLPKVGLQAAWSLEGPILVEVPPVNRNLSYWYVGVGVSYNLSSLFKNDRSLARSRAATRSAQARLEAESQNISLDVRASYIRYMEAYEELKARQKEVELAERNYNVTATRFSNGMALITDMLDAANARLEAGQLLVNARIDIIYYYYKLLFTSGKI